MLLLLLFRLLLLLLLRCPWPHSLDHPTISSLLPLPGSRGGFTRVHGGCCRSLHPWRLLRLPLLLVL